MGRVLVLEDNPDLLDDVCFQLRHAGYQVEGLLHDRALDAALQQFAPDLLVLDLGLPGEDGIDIATRLRAQCPQLGIIMLTARTTLEQRLLGHARGADHYLCKPVEMQELLAVTAALLRRLRQATPVPAQTVWVLDLLARQLRTPTGVVIELTANESCLLACLSAAPGHHAGREELVAALGQKLVHYDERRLETMLSRLRRKIGLALGDVPPLKAWRSKGYVFAAPLRQTSPSAPH